MRYSDFTLEKLEDSFGTKNQIVSLFDHVKPIKASDWLVNSLKIAQTLPIRTEKSRSELIVSPILVEIHQRSKGFLTIYSGESLNIDTENGLKGECDFIIAKNLHTFNLSHPIIQIVEAKKNDLDLGVAQCAAQMMGAKLFNEKKKSNVDSIYGCVTTGVEWLFMRLEDKIYIDSRKYYLQNIQELLGVFELITNHYKENISE